MMKKKNIIAMLLLVLSSSIAISSQKAKKDASTSTHDLKEAPKKQGWKLSHTPQEKARIEAREKAEAEKRAEAERAKRKAAEEKRMTPAERDHKEARNHAKNAGLQEGQLNLVEKHAKRDTSSRYKAFANDMIAAIKDPSKKEALAEFVEAARALTAERDPKIAEMDRAHHSKELIAPDFKELSDEDGALGDIDEDDAFSDIPSNLLPEIAENESKIKKLEDEISQHLASLQDRKLKASERASIHEKLEKAQDKKDKLSKELDAKLAKRRKR